MGGLEPVKSFIKIRFPICISIIEEVRELLRRLKSKRSIFAGIYENHGFGGEESISGPGSSLEQTSVIRQEMPKLLEELEAKSLLDAPCGDFHWMKEADLELDLYIGGDIVPDLIAQNREKYACETRKFMTLDITMQNLPQVDLILCRDCLIHLSFKHCVAAIRNFRKSRSRYLLTTTYAQLTENRDIRTGLYRPINLQAPPFDFPEPIQLINEGCTEEDGRYSDKSIGLWRLDDISL